MTERRIAVPGGQLAVHDFGVGRPVVLLHAGIVNSWAWEPLTPYLLDAGYRVVAFDRRGSGDSVTDDVAYSNRADIVAVLDALGLDRAALVGNSVGGQIAVDTAIEFPARVAAVVTIGASIGGWFPQQTPEEDALDAEMERLAAEGDSEVIADLDVRAWVDGPGQPADRVPAEIRELVREMDREAIRLRPPSRQTHPAGAIRRQTARSVGCIAVGRGWRARLLLRRRHGPIPRSQRAGCSSRADAGRGPHDRPGGARRSGDAHHRLPRDRLERSAERTYHRTVITPRKPRDVGNGLVCASFGGNGEWLSLATVHPKAGFVELTGLPLFAPEWRGDADAVRRYRSWMRREEHAFLHVEAGRATIATRQDAPRGTRGVVQRVVITASRRDRPAGIRNPAQRPAELARPG